MPKTKYKFWFDKEWEIRVDLSIGSVLVQVRRFDNDLKSTHFNAGLYIKEEWGYPSVNYGLPKPPDYLLSTIKLWTDNCCDMNLEDFLKALNLKK